MGSPCTILEKSAGGFLPRHKFDSVQTALRIMVMRSEVLSTLQKRIKLIVELIFIALLTAIAATECQS